MIDLVISGGQTGSDLAGWRAAKAAGIPTGGWMPKHFRTEDGPKPEYADLYGAKEHPSAQYPPRTVSNIGLADGTIVFNLGEFRSAGTRLAINSCESVSQPLMVVVVHRVNPDEWTFSFGKPTVLDWIKRNQIRVLNVAGNRESGAPGIGAAVESYLADVFRLAKEGGGS